MHWLLRVLQKFWICLGKVTSMPKAANGEHDKQATGDEGTREYCRPGNAQGDRLFSCC
jgi:hypothetical protein